MTEQIEKILSSVRQQLSVELPDYATISMQLGLFESTHTAKQSEEAPVQPQVRPFIYQRSQGLFPCYTVCLVRFPSPLECRLFQDDLQACQATFDTFVEQLRQAIHSKEIADTRVSLLFFSRTCCELPSMYWCDAMRWTLTLHLRRLGSV